MVNINSVVEFLFPQAVILVDYTVSQGSVGGPYISQWNEAKLGPHPTQEYLESVENSAEYQGRMLAKEKSVKNAAIDVKSQQIIARGFAWNGGVFSLSAGAQMNWTNLFISRNFVPYPLRISTIDDGEFVLNSANEMALLYNEGVGYVKSILDAGRALKVQVQQATTVEEVRAIQDTRGGS